jgi:hypothetical protein
VITLGPDAALDGARVAALVAGAGTGRKKGQESRFRLTPDLKLVARVEPDLSGERLLDAAREVLREVARCAV